MNDATIEIPEGLVNRADVKVPEPGGRRVRGGRFENALADAQAEWEKPHPAPTAEELPSARHTWQPRPTPRMAARRSRPTRRRRCARGGPLACRRVRARHGRRGGGLPALCRRRAHRRQGEPGRETVDAQVVVEGVPEAISVAAIDVVADAAARSTCPSWSWTGRMRPRGTRALPACGHDGARVRRAGRA